jgi:hypothetical protein
VSWLKQLLQQDGRPVMILVVLLVLYPLSLQRHIREVRALAVPSCSLAPLHTKEVCDDRIVGLFVLLLCPLLLLHPIRDACDDDGVAV